MLCLAASRPLSRAERRCGFTLVELLVVIGIIAMLVAILLPTLAGVIRRATVLACPVAFVDANNTLWICDLKGQRSLQVSTIPVYNYSVRWSPRGDRIAYTSYARGKTIVVNPATRQVIEADILESLCWVDDETLLGTKWFGAHNELWRINPRTGQASPWKKLRDLGEPYGHVNADYEPIMSPGYVVAESEQLWAPQNDIVFRGKDWTRKPTIWADPNNDVMDMQPAIDPMGEWVAWTRARRPGNCLEKVVALKHVREGSGQRPREFGQEYPSVSFCNRTGDSELLVAITRNDGSTSLALMDRDGRIIRELALPAPLAPHIHGPIASMRHYHRW